MFNPKHRDSTQNPPRCVGAFPRIVSAIKTGRARDRKCFWFRSDFEREHSCSILTRPPTSFALLFVAFLWSKISFKDEKRTRAKGRREIREWLLSLRDGWAMARLFSPPTIFRLLWDIGGIFPSTGNNHAANVYFDECVWPKSEILPSFLFPAWERDMRMNILVLGT